MASLTTNILNAALRAAASVLHPRENLYNTGNLGAANAELQVFTDSCGTVTIDLRGTFNLTMQLQGSIDGVNFTHIIPVRPTTGGAFVAAVVGSTVGGWQGSCSGYTKVRAIVTVWTSGAATTFITASNSQFDVGADSGGYVPLAATNTAAAGAAVTLTIPAPGAGLRQYITHISVDRIASALLTAAAAPVVVTTTNLPGSLAFSMPADAAAQGTVFTRQLDLTQPLMASAQNTAVTIVCPLTTNVIWRATALYYVAP